MGTEHLRIFFGILAIIVLAWTKTAFGAPPPTPSWFTWTTVVNNNDMIPDALPVRTFNSYNQPSVNADGLVVFRGRSREGGSLGPATHGIYIRDMAVSESGIVKILDRTTQVPAPNNLGATFIETPSFPRIDMWSGTIVTRGNHQPVYAYLPIGELEDTQVGTSGIYVGTDGELLTGAAKLGSAPGFELFAVPGITPPVPFEIFPGAPSVTDGFTIAFKGNYTTVDGLSQTGIFYRNLEHETAGGHSPVILIANSSFTEIPGSDPPVVFGSTSPPSAAGGLVVFTGFDNEQSPSLGGVYLAPLAPEPDLTPLVEIGSSVPGESVSETFTHLGEGIAFDGRYVGFWGAWGSEMKTVRLYCPDEGNKDRIVYCNNTSICDDTNRCYQLMEVPVHQGIFVHDIQSHRTIPVAKTGPKFDEFLFWNYSGKVPGNISSYGEGDETDGEPARWRSSAFVAVSGRGDQTFYTAFKGAKGEIEGIYLGLGPGRATLSVLDTTMDGQAIDPEAPSESTITEVGLEREGLRNEWLVVNARMGSEGTDEEEGMAGIYLTKVPSVPRSRP